MLRQQEHFETLPAYVKLLASKAAGQMLAQGHSFAWPKPSTCIQKTWQQLRRGSEVQDIDKARSAGLGHDGKVTLVSGDVTAGPEALVKAIGSAQAVICATGYSGRV